MIGLAVKINSDQTLAAITSLAAPVQQEALESIGVLLVARAKDNIAARTGPTGAWPSAPWDTLYAGPRIWNDISRSLGAEVKGTTLAVGATHIAAPVRQLGTIGAGGTLPDIVPVKKKALTQPLSDAASRASYQGIDARTAFPGAFILHRGGLAIIARYTGGRTNKKTGQKVNQKLEELYLLRRSVAIRPHPFLPIDKSGNLAPASLWNEIDELIVNNFVKGGS